MTSPQLTPFSSPATDSTTIPLDAYAEVKKTALAFEARQKVLHQENLAAAATLAAADAAATGAGVNTLMMQTKNSRSLVDKAEENVASVSVPDARPIPTPPTLLIAKQNAEDEEQKRRMERAAAKRARKFAAMAGRHQSPPTGKNQSTIAPQTTSIRKRTPSSKTVKSHSEMNLAEFLPPP